MHFCLHSLYSTLFTVVCTVWCGLSHRRREEKKIVQKCNKMNTSVNSIQYISFIAGNATQPKYNINVASQYMMHAHVYFTCSLFYGCELELRQHSPQLSQQCLLCIKNFKGQLTKRQRKRQDSRTVPVSDCRLLPVLISKALFPLAMRLKIPKPLTLQFSSLLPQFKATANNVISFLES